LIAINGRTMDGGAMAADSVYTIDTKIFMKVRDLKDS